MLRRAFLKRMAFAALATWFLDLPLPAEPDDAFPTSRSIDVSYNYGDGWKEYDISVVVGDDGTVSFYLPGTKALVRARWTAA